MNKSAERKPADIDRAYSSEPWWYDARGFLILTFAYRTTLPAQLKHISDNIKNNHLEVAIGSGTLFDLILKWRKWKNQPEVSINGFDYAERMLAGARHRFGNNKQISLVRADAASLSWDTNFFDSANAANCIHCFPELEKSLGEIYRVLKPSGTLAGNCIIEPRGQTFMDWIARRINTWGMKKGILYRPYQVGEIRTALKDAGFTLIKEKLTGYCFDFIAQK